MFKKITQDLKINLLGHDEECPVHAGLVTEGEYVKQIGSGEDDGTLELLVIRLGPQHLGPISHGIHHLRFKVLLSSGHLTPFILLDTAKSPGKKIVCKTYILC